MAAPNERLREARKLRYATAAEAARALGARESTYQGHENGSRGFKAATAARYAHKFGVALEWLMTGRGPRDRIARPPEANRAVPIVGYVEAGGVLNFGGEPGDLGEIAAPEFANGTTVAVEIRGDSLGPVLNRWIAFYDEVRRPVTADLVNQLCVVGLDDDRVVIKEIQRGHTRGLYHLLSNTTAAPIFDVPIEWAARVKALVPR